MFEEDLIVGNERTEGFEEISNTAHSGIFTVQQILMPHCIILAVFGLTLR